MVYFFVYHRFMNQTILFFLFCVPFLSWISGCQERKSLYSPQTLYSKGVALGSLKPDVIQRLGKAGSEINYSSNGKRISILLYDSFQFDFNPAYEKDDVGIFTPRSGISDSYRRDYRLVFIDQKLSSIEDFINGQYYALPSGDMEDAEILDKVRSEMPRK